MVPYHDLHNQYPYYGSRPTSHGFCPHDHHMPPQPRPPPPPGSGGRLSERLSSFVKGATVGRLVHEAVVFVAGKVCLDDGGDLINFDTSFYDDLIMNRARLPSAGMFKLKVDASLDVQALKTGVGAIVAGLCSHFVGASTPIYAKAKALQATLSWGVVMHFPLKAVESDCQALVNKIKHKWKDQSFLLNLVQLLQNYLSSFPNVSLNYISRMIMF
uniref:RNase H type-1 domain-containing protein n=1 Tax=Cannabis sativa TaxID=3483 RepID=A0A803Q955_CANSA